MKEIEPHVAMIMAAKDLNEGEILIVYLDENCVRMETKEGNDPYVWRNNKWVRMGEPC